jgi:hypothetical protein
MKWLGIQRPISEPVLRVARRVRRRIIEQGCGKSNGSCGDASSQIAGELRGLGIWCQAGVADFCSYKKRKEKRCWEGHVVVRIDRRFILDVTADQFNDALMMCQQQLQMRAIVYGTNCDLDYRYNMRCWHEY